MVKRPKKFLIVDDSSPGVAQAKSREQRVPSFFHVKIWILNGVPWEKLVKVWIFRAERGRQHVFWPLSGQWLPKQLTEKLSWTIIRVVKREKLSSTIMKNLNKLKLNDSWWYSMIVHDSWWSNGSARSTIIDYYEPFDQGLTLTRTLVKKHVSPISKKQNKTKQHQLN